MECPAVGIEQHEEITHPADKHGDKGANKAYYRLPHRDWRAIGILYFQAPCLHPQCLSAVGPEPGKEAPGADDHGSKQDVLVQRIKCDSFAVNCACIVDAEKGQDNKGNDHPDGHNQDAVIGHGGEASP